MLSLLFFILFSAFHFGESELEEEGLNLSSLLLYAKAFVFGLCILLFIIFTHHTESQEIISLFNVNFPLSLRIFDQSIYAVWIASISFLYILIQTILSKKYAHFGLLFLLLLGIKTPLILAFGLYFIFQHSLNAWGHLQHGLKMDGFTLYKKALPFTLSAIFFLCAMLFYNSVAVLNLNEFIATLFIFLSHEPNKQFHEFLQVLQFVQVFALEIQHLSLIPFVLNLCLQLRNRSYTSLA